MQDVEQEVHHHNQRGGMRVEEVEPAGENRQDDVGPEEHFQFADAVGQHFRQHTAAHHADYAEADKQGGEAGALAHDPGDVVHGCRHTDKTRADVAQRQKQDAHPLIVFPHIFQISFQIVIAWYCRTNTLSDGGEAEQEHTHAQYRQNAHCHLITFGFVAAAKPINHRQQGKRKNQRRNANHHKAIRLAGHAFFWIVGNHASQRAIGNVDCGIG
ncbi:hypothetical protein D3C75_573570 [compost metagenome]